MTSLDGQSRLEVACRESAREREGGREGEREGKGGKEREREGGKGRERDGGRERDQEILSLSLFLAQTLTLASASRSLLILDLKHSLKLGRHGPART